MGGLEFISAIDGLLEDRITEFFSQVVPQHIQRVIFGKSLDHDTGGGSCDSLAANIEFFQFSNALPDEFDVIGKGELVYIKTFVAGNNGQDRDMDIGTGVVILMGVYHLQFLEEGLDAGFDLFGGPDQKGKSEPSVIVGIDHRVGFITVALYSSQGGLIKFVVMFGKVQFM